MRRLDPCDPCWQPVSALNYERLRHIAHGRFCTPWYHNLLSLRIDLKRRCSTLDAEDA